MYARGKPTSYVVLAIAGGLPGSVPQTPADVLTYFLAAYAAHRFGALSKNHSIRRSRDRTRQCRMLVSSTASSTPFHVKRLSEV